MATNIEKEQTKTGTDQQKTKYKSKKQKKAVELSKTIRYNRKSNSTRTNNDRAQAIRHYDDEQMTKVIRTFY